MRHLSIRLKLVLAIVGIMAISGAASAGLVWALYARTAQRSSEEALRSAAAAFQELERQDVARMSVLVDALAAHPGLRDAFANRDRERLLAVAQPIQQGLKSEHGIGHWNFVDADTRRMFLRVHLPAKFGDLIERPTLVKAMERREMSAGLELGKSAFALRVGKPVYADSRLIGYIEMGEEVDHFLGRMKQQSGNDYAMFFSKKLLDASEWARTRGAGRNNWGDFPDVVAVNSTTTEPMIDATTASLADAGRIVEEESRSESVYARGVFPVRDATGAVVGGLVVRHDITPLHAAMRSGMLQAVAFFVGLAALASVLVSLLADRLIFRRLRVMMSTMEDASERMAGGDYQVAGSVKSGSDDELGRFEGFFSEFLGLVGSTLRTLVERRRAVRPTAPAVPGTPG
jgi:Double sensory domain of two-component sensor kinase